MQRYGEKLRTLRKKHGLTQVQLAEQTGLSQTYIGELEAGKKQPGTHITVTIADFFGVPIDVLVRDELELNEDNHS